MLWTTRAAGRRRRVRRLVARRDAAVAAQRWPRALQTNTRAIAAMRPLTEPVHVHVNRLNSRLLASLCYHQAIIHEALEEYEQALEAATEAAHLYRCLDPTDAIPRWIEGVLSELRAPVVVTDPRTVRQLAEAHQRREREAEEAIAQAADAWMLQVHMEARAHGHLIQERTVREQASWSVNIYRELARVGHYYDAHDVARIEAEQANALRARARSGRQHTRG